MKGRVYPSQVDDHGRKGPWDDHKNKLKREGNERRRRTRRRRTRRRTVTETNSPECHGVNGRSLKIKLPSQN